MSDKTENDSILCGIAGIILIIVVIIGIASFIIWGYGSSNDTTPQEDLPHLNVTSSDTFYYYGEDTPAGKNGYTYAIIVNGSVYYMHDSTAQILGSYDPSMQGVIYYDLQKYDGRYTPSAYIVGSGGVNAVYDTTRDHDYTMFEFENNNNFTITYTTGNKVGANDDAKVVSKIYYPNGTEMTKKGE